MFLDLHVKVKSEWRNDERVLDEINIQNRGVVYGLTRDSLPPMTGTVSTKRAPRLMDARAIIRERTAIPDR